MPTLWKHGFSALMLGLAAIVSNASAADFTRQPGNGAWNDPNLWSPVGVPGASDNARIESTAGNITFTAAATVGLLDVAGTYTGTIALGSNTLTASQVSFAGGTFNGETGALVCNGSFAFAGGVFNAPPALTFKGNVTIPSGTFNHGNGAVLFAANYQAAQTIAAGATVFNNVTIKGNSISITTVQGDLHVDGNLSLETTSSSGCALNGGRILAKQNVTMASAGVGTWDHPGNAWIVFCGATDQTLNGAATGRFTNIRIDKPSGVLHLAGLPLVFGSWDWVHADGLDAGASSITFATPYSAVVSIKGGPVTYGDVSFKGWGQYSKHDLVGDLQIGGDLTLDVVAYSGNQVNGASFIVAGDVIMNNAGFGSASWGPGNSTIKLTGSGSHAIIAHSSGHFPNMHIDTTGSVTTVGDVTVGGNWTFVNGTFTQGAGTLEFQAPYGATRSILPGTSTYGNVTITGNGLSNQAVSGTLNVSGKFVLTAAGYVGAKLNGGTVAVQGDFELPGDGFGASDGGPGSAVIRLAGTGNQTVTAGGLARCPTLEIDAAGTVTFVGSIRLGAHYVHTSGTVQTAGSTQTFVGRQDSLVTGAAQFGALVVQKGPYGAPYKVTLDGNATASGGFTLTEGTFVFASNATLAVANDVAVAASNVSVTAGAASTLTLNGSTAQNVNLAGKTVFNLNVANAAGTINFTAPYTAQGTTSAVPGATLAFASGGTFNTGKLAMHGTQAQGITLRAATEGSAANVVAAPYQFVRYASIKDINASGGPRIVALHGTDSGNNQNVVFQAAALLNLAAGNTSVTSPAWVEGASGPDVTNLTVALNGETPFPASRLNPTQYYGSNQASGHALGIELSASAATNVEIAASNAFGESNTATQNIAWAATDLAGKSYSTDQLKIRINSKLRFVLDNHDSNVGETVRIDTNNDGTFEYTGVEGESIEHLFSASGSVIVRGEIGGLAAGSLTVIVVDTNLHGPVACQKGYERGLDVFALPATEAASIAYAAADPYAVGLTVTQVTGDGALLKLKPSVMDSPAFVSRLGDAAGPIIDIQPLLVFTVKDLNSHILGFGIDSTGYGRAIIRYQITPRTVIDNDNPVTTAQEGLYFDLGCLGTDMVFAENGLSSLRVHSNRQDANGIFEVEALLAPTGTFVCHSIQPRQINSNYTVGDYFYHNPCVMKVAGGLYLHREMSDETTRDGKANLYPEGHNEAGKQIFQVWDQDPQIDGRWTAEIEVPEFTPQEMEQRFFIPAARKPIMPNRHFTVKVEQPGNSFSFAVRMLPGTTGIRGGADIDDNTGVNRDEILYERVANELPNYLKWTNSFPSAYPALNLPPNHWGHDYQDKSRQYKSWDSIFFRYYPHPWYTDIGFWKGNMIGKMTVWGTCHPSPIPTPRKKVLPNIRPDAPTNPHTNVEADTLSPFWVGDETEFRDILVFGRLEADGHKPIGQPIPSLPADYSSRDAFPDIIGANTYEIHKTIPAPTPSDPNATQDLTYLRTFHQGNEGTAKPTPVQITFRAPPNTKVRVGVSIATRVEENNSELEEHVTDDGEKTHKAWVHLSDKAIFEYRGQDDYTNADKAKAVYEVKSVDANNEVITAPLAERVVSFELDTKESWFASKTVYVYGIELSQRPDDLKLVVWGEEIMDWKAYPKEVQTHHYQNNDKDPDCPIKRWYITDEEPLTVASRTYVPLEMPTDFNVPLAACVVPLELKDRFEGKPLKFKVYKNGILDQTIDATFSNSSAATTFFTSKVPGDKYWVETEINGNVLSRSETLDVVPGDPALAAYEFNDGLFDGTTTITGKITIRDKYGNIVKNGTSLDFLKHTSNSIYLTAPGTDTTSGEAFFSFTSPDMIEKPILRLHSGPFLKENHTLEAKRITGSLTSTRTVIRTSSPEYADLTLQCDAADGTKVRWAITNGTDSRLQQTTLNGGTSTIRIAADRASVQTPQHIGPTWVSATIGSQRFNFELTYVNENDFYLKIGDGQSATSENLGGRVLSGSTTQDGIFTFNTGQANNFPMPPSYLPQWRSRSFPYHSKTFLRMFGLPQERVRVGFDNSFDEQFLDILGVGAEPPTLNEITLGTTGLGAYLVLSKGNYAHVQGILGHKVPIAATSLNRPSLWKETITIEELGYFSYISDAVWSFLGDDPQTGLGIASNIAGGVLIIGDVGSLVKNLSRGLGVSDGDVNWVEVSLSGLGLATELAVAAGEVADVPITAVRAYAAALGRTKFVDVLVQVFKNSLDTPQDLAKIGTFLTKVASDGSGKWVKTVDAICTSEKLLKAGINIEEELGDDALEALADIAQNASKGGVEGAQSALRVLDDLDEATLAALKNSGKLQDALTGMGKAIAKGIDPELLTKILKNDLFGAGYEHADLLIDLGVVADKLSTSAEAISGYYRLANTLKNTGGGRFGFLYELQVAAHFARSSDSAIMVSKFVNTAAGKTDIDTIVGGVYYQVKRSENAFRGGRSVAESTRRAHAWVRKAILDGAGSTTNVKWITQPGVTVPAKIEALLTSLGVQILRIPAKGRAIVP